MTRRHSYMASIVVTDHEGVESLHHDGSSGNTPTTTLRPEINSSVEPSPAVSDAEDSDDEVLQMKAPRTKDLSRFLDKHEPNIVEKRRPSYVISSTGQAQILEAHVPLAAKASSDLTAIPVTVQHRFSVDQFLPKAVPLHRLPSINQLDTVDVDTTRYSMNDPTRQSMLLEMPRKSTFIGNDSTLEAFREDSLVVAGEHQATDGGRRPVLHLSIRYTMTQADASRSVPKMQLELSEIQLANVSEELMASNPFVEFYLHLSASSEAVAATVPLVQHAPKDSALVRTTSTTKFNHAQANAPVADDTSITWRDILVFDWDGKRTRADRAEAPKDASSLQPATAKRSLSTSRSRYPILRGVIKCNTSQTSSTSLPPPPAAALSNNEAGAVTTMPSSPRLGSRSALGSSSDSSFEMQSLPRHHSARLSGTSKSQNQFGIAALLSSVAASPAFAQPAAANAMLSSSSLVQNTSVVSAVGEIVVRLANMRGDSVSSTWYRVTALHPILHDRSNSASLMPKHLLQNIKRRFGIHDRNMQSETVDLARVLHNNDPSKHKLWRKRCSLRTLIALFLCIFLIVAVATSVSITYTASKDQTLKTAAALLAAQAVSIDNQLGELLLPPLVTTTVAANMLHLMPSPNITVLAHAISSTFSQTDAMLNATLLYCATPTGLFVGAGLTGDNFDTPWIAIVDPSGGLVRDSYGVSTTCLPWDLNCQVYNTSNVLYPPAAYNATSRAWYALGITTTTPAWTSVYTFSSPVQAGISGVAPVRDPVSGEILYVVAIDLLLTGISSYMEGLDLQEGGLSMLLEPSTSNLIATSVNAPLEAGGSLVIAQHSVNQAVAEVSQGALCALCGCPRNGNYSWYCGALAPLHPYQQVETFTLSNDMLATVHLFRDLTGLEFILIVAVPQSVFLEGLNTAIGESIGAAAGITVGSCLLGFLILTLVTRQLMRTTKQLSEFSDMNFSSGVDESDLNAPIKEVSRVSKALLHMRASLRSFSKYVPLEVVQYLGHNNMVASLGGDRRFITIFFSDIADFTKISEKLDLDMLIELLGEYLEEMSTIVNSHGGMVDKYIGDAIMALWNVPVAKEGHPVLACSAALECHRRLAELRKAWVARGFPEVAARIGIHSGEAIAGNFGSKARLNYTAIGDAVNLASRLEGLNKSYGTYVMISQDTYAHVRDFFVCRPLDLVAVKGKALPVVVYELICHVAEATSDQITKAKLFTRAFEAYIARDFFGAQQLFVEYQQLVPDDEATKLQLENLTDLIHNPMRANLVRVMHEK
ncbi:hypothetical protein, variant [Capsaspora owczarzaki ATCC 30864]|nr:hypothetical protein, variant [Capsaspora owczarzaki ATCC 30864]